MNKIMISDPTYFSGSKTHTITLKTKDDIAYSNEELEDMFAEDEFIKKWNKKMNESKKIKTITDESNSPGIIIF